MPTRLQRMSLIILVAIALTLGAHSAPVRAAIPPHLGYGVSIGPHIDIPPGMLDTLGADWVLVYDTDQIGKFPHQRVLYRTDVRGYPDNVTAWEKGISALAKQIKAQGASAIAIGNEPNLRDEWGGQPPDAARYADILCRGYRAVKQVAPELIVVSGGLAPTGNSDRSADDLTFAQQMFSAGAGSCFDAFGYHPYGYNQAPEAEPARNRLNFRRAELMYALLLRNGISDRQIWITEFGWVRNPSEDGQDCNGTLGFRDFQWMMVSRYTQADYTVRAFALADANWPWAGPTFLWNLNWHQYATDYESACSNLRFFSMLDQNGAPLPVYYAFQQMTKHPASYGPRLGASLRDMTRVAEAGCAGLLDMGSFTVVNTGYSGSFQVDVKPANGPGVPLVVATTSTAGNGTVVRVAVDANKVKPGLYLLPINLRARINERTVNYVVKAWLLLHYPTTPECVARYNAQQIGG